VIRGDFTLVEILVALGIGSNHVSGNIFNGKFIPE